MNLSKEKMREYQRCRRSRMKTVGDPAYHCNLVDKVYKKMAIRIAPKRYESYLSLRKFNWEKYIRNK